MTFRVLENEFPADRVPLLRWLIFTGVTIFGFALAWYFGLFRIMLAADKTHLSAIIVVLYVATTLHCLMRTTVISRELDQAHRVLAIVRKETAGYNVAGQNVVTAEGVRLPPCAITEHIRSLTLKAHAQSSRFALDQTLLLRGLVDLLRGPNLLGNFASDSLMKLGLLGTIIGFILMLAPIAGLDTSDKNSIKTSMGLMSDGMAVAMYTTLTGLVGSILIKTQYYLLDEATAKLFALCTDLTEVFVIPVLEREQDEQAR
jgi:hypothetical protein